MARILWRDAQGNEGSLALSSAEAGIGRAMDCAIRTDDAMVSRHHARIWFEGGRYFIEDLGSSNGVYFQERRVQRHGLAHGDAVRCGSLWLRFIEQEPQEEAPPTAAGLEPVGTPPTDSAGARAIESPTSGRDSDVQLRRRIEQLQAELRLVRGGGPGAKQLEDLENEVARLSAERDQLDERVKELETRISLEGGDAKVRRAGAIAETAGEIVTGLNDVLSNLRINVMAAQGEFEQFADAIPRASFELIREALRSSADDMDTARTMLRKLRELAGVSGI